METSQEIVDKFSLLHPQKGIISISLPSNEEGKNFAIKSESEYMVNYKGKEPFKDFRIHLPEAILYGPNANSEESSKKTKYVSFMLSSNNETFEINSNPKTKIVRDITFNSCSKLNTGSLFFLYQNCRQLSMFAPKEITELLNLDLDFVDKIVLLQRIQYKIKQKANSQTPDSQEWNKLIFLNDKEITKILKEYLKESVEKKNTVMNQILEDDKALKKMCKLEKQKTYQVLGDLWSVFPPERLEVLEPYIRKSARGHYLLKTDYKNFKEEIVRAIESPKVKKFQAQQDLYFRFLDPQGLDDAINIVKRVRDALSQEFGDEHELDIINQDIIKLCNRAKLSESKSLSTQSCSKGSIAPLDYILRLEIIMGELSKILRKIRYELIIKRQQSQLIWNKFQLNNIPKLLDDFIRSTLAMTTSKEKELNDMLTMITLKEKQPSLESNNSKIIPVDLPKKQEIVLEIPTQKSETDDQLANSSSCYNELKKTQVKLRILNLKENNLGHYANKMLKFEKEELKKKFNYLKGLVNFENFEHLIPNDIERLLDMLGIVEQESVKNPLDYNESLEASRIVPILKKNLDFLKKMEVSLGIIQSKITELKNQNNEKKEILEDIEKNLFELIEITERVIISAKASDQIRNLHEYNGD